MICGSNKSRLSCAFVIVALCLYLPFSWLLACGNASHSYCFIWLKLWPILPGFLPGFYLFHPREAPEFTLMGGTTLALLIGLTWLGLKGRRALGFAAGVALLVSVSSSFVSYAVFRA